MWEVKNRNHRMMRWHPSLYKSSFSLVLCLLGSVPSSLLTTSLSQSVPRLAPVCEAIFWITVAAEVVPEEWSNWSYPITDQPDGCCFHTACPADVLGCPTPQALLCNRSILALSKEFSFIVFGLLPCRQETQPECFCIFSMTSVP